MAQRTSITVGLSTKPRSWGVLEMIGRRDACPTSAPSPGPPKAGEPLLRLVRLWRRERGFTRVAQPTGL